VSERVASGQGPYSDRAEQARHRPRMAFSFTDYVPVIDPPWTWTGIPTSVITQLLFELPPCLFEVPPCLALPQVQHGLH